MELILKDVRLIHPVLWKAKEFKEGDGKPRWSANLVVVPGSDNDKNIERAIAAEASSAWGNKAEQTLKGMRGQKMQFCYLDGGAKGLDDTLILSAHRHALIKGSPNSRPLIIDRDKSPLIAEDGRPYNGCYVNAKVEIYCQKGENPGVRASFSVIQFLRDGEAFSGGAEPTADDMDAIADGANTDAMV